MDDFFQIFVPCDGVRLVFICFVVAVAVGNATLDYIVIDREYKATATDFEKEFYRFKYFNGFFRQAAVEVVNLRIVG